MIPRSYVNRRVLMPRNYGGSHGTIIGVSNNAKGLSNYCFVRLDNRRQPVRLWEGDLANATILPPTNGVSK
jgi:hypothetical protein